MVFFVSSAPPWFNPTPRARRDSLPTTWNCIDAICNPAAPGSARHALASRL
jgi:hypothetical protein